jgi:EmrB/QacA subfamily drug resistance transporter
MKSANRSKSAVVPMLAIVAFVSLMDGMDGSIVNVTLPTLASQFGTDTGTIAWVTVTYFLMIAGTVLIFAKIASNGHIKKILIAGLIVFTFSSLMCGISESLQSLLIFRVLQGLGAAMMGATTPIICVRYLPTDRLATGLGVISLGNALGYSLGPALGGFLLGVASWHWVFLINVPLGIFVLPLLLKYVPNDIFKNNNHIDITGTVLFFLMMAFGIIALDRSSHPGDVLIAGVSAILFVIMLTAFIVVELRKKTPLLNVRVFKHWEYTFVFLAFLIVNLTYMGVLYLIPFYFDINLGMGPYTSGLYLLIPSVVTLIMIIPMSRLSDGHGKRPFGIGACLMLACAFAIWYLFASEGNRGALVVALILMGLTWSCSGGAMASRLIEKTTDESREMGSSLMTISVYIGCVAGTALYAGLFTKYTESGGIDFTSLPPETFLSGLMFTLVISVILTILGAVMSAVVKDS